MINGLIVQALLLACKLTGLVDWSWWVIMAPALALAAIVVFFVIIIGVLVAWAKVWEWREGKKRP